MSESKSPKDLPKNPGESLESSNHNVDVSANDLAELAAAELATGDKAGSELDGLKQQLQDAESRALRYQADLDNFRRRARRDADEQIKYASLNLINGILDALDNLERALSAATPTESQSGLVQGVRMVANQILDTLQAAGCQKIEAQGQPFDPKWHQAVQSQPSSAVPPNHVLQELRTGYQLHDRIVRPAQVIVSDGPTDQKS